MKTHVNIGILNAIVISSLSILFFAILVTVAYNLSLDNLKKLSNSFYGESPFYFSIERTDVDIHAIANLLPDQSALYNELSRDPDVRGVIVKGDYSPPRLMSGHFFNKDDFEKNSKTAVVGKLVNADLVSGEHAFVSFDDELYEIIGTIGYDMPTRLDKTIFLSLVATDLKLSANYVIDCDNPQYSLDFLGHEEHFGNVVVFDKNPLSIMRVVDSENNHIVTSALFLFCIFTSGLSLTSFWLEKRTPEIRIQIMNGFSRFQAFKAILCDYCRLVAVSFVIGLSIAIAFEASNHYIHINMISFLYSAIGMFSVFFFIISLSSYKKINQYKTLANDDVH
jgi:hypothetical protein